MDEMRRYGYHWVGGLLDIFFLELGDQGGLDCGAPRVERGGVDGVGEGGGRDYTGGLGEEGLEEGG